MSFESLTQCQLRSVLYCFKTIKRHLSATIDWYKFCSIVLGISTSAVKCHVVCSIKISAITVKKGEAEANVSMKLTSASPCLLDACTKPRPPWTRWPGTPRCTASMALRLSATLIWSSPGRRSDQRKASQSLHHLLQTHWLCLPPTHQYHPSNQQQMVPRNSQGNLNLHHHESLIIRAQRTGLNAKMMQQLLKVTTTIFMLTAAATTMAVWVRSPLLTGLGGLRQQLSVMTATIIRSSLKHTVIMTMIQQKLKPALKPRFDSEYILYCGYLTAHLNPYKRKCLSDA